MSEPDISTVDGRKAYQQQILKTLIAHLELDKAASEIETNDDPKLMAQARLARKQYKEHGELVLSLLKEIDQ